MNLKTLGYSVEGRRLNFDGFLTTVSQCLQSLSDNKVLGASPFTDEQLSMIALLENNYDCAGLCSPAPFWFTKDMGITNPPDQDCINPLKS